MIFSTIVTVNGKTGPREVVLVEQFNAHLDLMYIAYRDQAEARDRAEHRASHFKTATLALLAILAVVLLAQFSGKAEAREPHSQRIEALEGRG